MDDLLSKLPEFSSDVFQTYVVQHLSPLPLSLISEMINPSHLKLDLLLRRKIPQNPEEMYNLFYNSKTNQKPTSSVLKFDVEMPDFLSVFPTELVHSAALPGAY